MFLILERLLQVYPTFQKWLFVMRAEHGKILGLMKQESSKT
jgi:hypothetical protein